MKAIRILEFGPPDVMQTTVVVRPEPAAGEMLVRVAAAGVGHWDALVREGTIGIDEKLPLTLGSEVAGTVEAIGKGVSGFAVGDEVYGLSSEDYVGGYAEYAAVPASTIAKKPQSLTFIEAAGTPVAALTASQMLFESAHVAAGQTVLIHGGAGNVGAYAVQIARNANVNVIATAGSRDVEYVKSLGAQSVVDFRKTPFEDAVPAVDAVLDTVGGETRDRSLRVLKPGGVLVTVVTPFPKKTGDVGGVTVVSMIVDVTTARLDALAKLFDSGKLATHVGTVLPLEQARAAHEMLAGAPHERGKIVLKVAA